MSQCCSSCHNYECSKVELPEWTSGICTLGYDASIAWFGRQGKVMLMQRWKATVLFYINKQKQNYRTMKIM